MGTLRVPIAGRDLFLFSCRTPEGCALMGTPWVPIWAPYGCPLQVAIYFILVPHLRCSNGHPMGAHMCTHWVHIKSACRYVKRYHPKGDNFGLFSRCLLANLRPFLFLVPHPFGLLQWAPYGPPYGYPRGTHSLRVKIPLVLNQYLDRRNTKNIPSLKRALLY